MPSGPPNLPGARPVRLADVLAGLSGFADLGFGLRAGEALRSSVLAVRLAESVDLSGAEVQAAFYTALLHHVGCPGYAHETARLFGDEIVANRAAGRTDTAAPSDLLTTFLPTLTHGRPVLQRARLVLTAAALGGRWGAGFTTAACEVGRDAARRLGLPEAVQEALLHVYDVWRGHGAGAVHGDDIPLAARIARLTGVAALFDTSGGPAAAVEAVRRRAGGMLDPGLAAQFSDAGERWLVDLAAADARVVALEAEPLPHVPVPDLRVVGEVFGDLADLKSPYFLGHSRGVAGLAAGTATRLGLDDDAKADLEVAALLHDVGRVAVSNAVWDRPGRLGTEEWEQVRLHPYHSERILAGSAELARLAPLVGRHHERTDGSGYHRGCTAADLSVPARILSAADAYRTWTEERPHRPALDPDEARARLAAEGRHGGLDLAVVDAVLVASGGPAAAGTARSPGPHGLSPREVEVLVLVAQARSNAEIAESLSITRRTAEHHVAHVYAKIGVSSRAAATLFAVEHGLAVRTDG